MTDTARFYEGAAACRDDAPQAQLEAALLHLREPEPAWGTIAVLVTEERVKLWRSALTALRHRATKAVASARAAGHLLVDNPANAGMREGGWEPWGELGARLIRMWGTANVTEGTAKGKDGKPFHCTFYAWPERLHGDGPQAGKSTRCIVVAHAQNPAWVRVWWASWREGMRPTRAAGITAAQAMGVDVESVFGASPPAKSLGLPSANASAHAPVGGRSAVDSSTKAGPSGGGPGLCGANGCTEPVVPPWTLCAGHATAVGLLVLDDEDEAAAERAAIEDEA